MENPFKSPKTGELHTATILTIITGLLSLGVLVGVILGRMPYEALFTLVLPLLGYGSMASKNKKEK